MESNSAKSVYLPISVGLSLIAFSSFCRGLSGMTVGFSIGLFAGSGAGGGGYNGTLVTGLGLEVERRVAGPPGFISLARRGEYPGDFPRSWARVKKRPLF